jgi:MFS family permease
MACSLVADPVLSVRLIKMGMKEDNTGFAFGVLGGSQAIGAPIAGWLGSKIPIKFVQLIGTILIILALYLMGPSFFPTNFLPDEIWVIFIGLFLMGFSVAFMFVLVAPEIIDSKGGEIKDNWIAQFKEEGLDDNQIKRKVKKQWKVASGILSDRASALCEMSFAMGSLIGPIVGGKLSDSYGYRHMTDYCCIAAIAAAIINFCVVFVPDFFMKKKSQIDLKDEDEVQVMDYEQK